MLWLVIWLVLGLVLGLVLRAALLLEVVLDEALSPEVLLGMVFVAALLSFQQLSYGTW